MHIFFSGIGGTGMGPLALIAKQAGFEVSGSDKQESVYTQQLQQAGVSLYIGQTTQAIAAEHTKNPIDWLAYSSSVTRENPNHPELVFAKENNIKTSKRDELINLILQKKGLKLVGIAGTHGKSTTTAMIIWLFHRLDIPIGYSVGAKIPFGPMGQLTEGSKYFVYECDEFDRNFLAFHPHLAAITGIGWDHHEIFPTEQSVKDAFTTFLGQCEQAILWQHDATFIGLTPDKQYTILNQADPSIALAGSFNRQDATVAVNAVAKLTDTPHARLIEAINEFPGLTQRMEQLAPNLYTNYAHTPEKIRGGIDTALELAKSGQDVVVIYEPLTNRRQHFIKNDYKNSFAGAKKLYWVPTYLAREDPTLPVLSPAALIPYLHNAHIAEPAELNDDLAAHIRAHLQQGDMVVAMGASGAGSLDEWLRRNVKEGSL